MIDEISDARLGPVNAGLPVAISKSTAPSAKMSVRASASLPSSCSGAMYWNVPGSFLPADVRRAGHRGTGRQEDCGCAGAIALARPKSSSLTPDFVSITLPGLNPGARSLAVRLVERVRNLRPVAQRLLERQRPLREAIRQRLASRSSITRYSVSPSRPRRRSRRCGDARAARWSLPRVRSADGSRGERCAGAAPSPRPSARVVCPGPDKPRPCRRRRTAEDLVGSEAGTWREAHGLRPAGATGSSAFPRTRGSRRGTAFQVLLRRRGPCSIRHHCDGAHGHASGVGRREFLPERGAAAFDVDLLHPCRISPVENMKPLPSAAHWTGHEETGQARDGARLPSSRAGQSTI